MKALPRFFLPLLIGLALSLLLHLATGQLCSLVLLTGFPCPWCGLTRSFFSLLSGDLTASLSLHPLLLPYLLLIPLFWAWRRGKVPAPLFWSYLALLLFATLLRYGIGMATHFPHRQPFCYHENNVLSILLKLIKGESP